MIALTESKAEKIPPIPYHLSEEDFRPREFEPVQYHLNDIVTRKNFTSYLIFSFSISQGVPHAQWTFFEWNFLKNGFDSKISLSSVLHANGWDALNERERNLFFSAVSGVKTHHKTLETVFSETGVNKSELKLLFNSEVKSCSEYTAKGVLYYTTERLAKMSWEELGEAVDYTIHKKREYYRKKGISDLF